MSSLYKGKSFGDSTLVGSVDGNMVYKANTLHAEHPKTEAGLHQSTIPFNAHPMGWSRQPTYQPTPFRNGLPQRVAVGYIEGNNIYRSGIGTERVLVGCVDGNTVYKVNILGQATPYIPYKEVAGFVEGNKVYKGSNRFYRVEVGHVEEVPVSPFNPKVTKELAGAALLLLL